SSPTRRSSDLDVGGRPAEADDAELHEEERDLAEGRGGPHAPEGTPGYAATRGSTCSRSSAIERSHAARGRHSWAITRSVPNPPTASWRVASRAATVSGSPTIQMLSRRYSSVTSASGIAGSILSISRPRIFPRSGRK